MIFIALMTAYTTVVQSHAIESSLVIDYSFPPTENGYVNSKVCIASKFTDLPAFIYVLNSEHKIVLVMKMS